MKRINLGNCKNWFNIGGIRVKNLKYYRLLCLYDYLTKGGTVYVQKAACLFGVDKRTILRDISDIRCYLADSQAINGFCTSSIVYNKNKCGYVLENGV